MTCPNCDKNKKSGTRGFPKAVVEINNPDKLILFRKIVVPASMGTERDFPATVGKYHNVLLQYEINGDTYLYSSDGIPTQISSDVSELQHQLNQLNIRLTDEIGERISADNDLTDALNAEILARQTGDTTLQTALDTEESERKAADNTLQSHINSEKAARIAADNTLQGNIDAEASTRATNDTALSARITEETTNRTNADTALGTRITNETTSRQNADNTLQANITAEETARKAADKTLQDNIDAEATTRNTADNLLQNAIDAEATTRANADTALGTRITDETTARESADTTLQGNITAEATTRANADTALTNKINTEITNRTDADTALGGRIDTEVTNRTNADTALGGRIDTEITNRTNADTAIENKLNRTVLYDLEMETDANNVTFVEDKVNLKTGGTSTERDVIPAASRTTAGTISASEYVSLVDAEEKITALLEGAVAIDNLPTNPTQAQLTAAWKTATGKDELINRASIYDSANQLVHTYYTNVSEWEDSPAGGQITIDQFTNSAAGIIKGSTTDGNVSANLDGTGTVSGWTSLKNTVAGKQDTLTAGSNISISGSTISATDTTYSAGTGLSLTGTTFAVDTTTIAQKSDIPTVNNATLTIQKNGTDVQTFTANSASNKTANITVPTKTSELTNDSNFPVDANYVHTDNNFTTTLKNKLDGIAAGAEVNQNAFSTVKVGSTNVAADSKTDTLELVAGSNVTLTPDATNDKVTIASTDTNTTYTFANGTNSFKVTPSGGTAQTVTVTPSIANATTSTAGLMSAADKTDFENLKPVVRKLYSDGTQIPANADLNTPTYLTVGRYGCGSNATVATLVNCPTNRGFMMDVYNTIDTYTDDQTTASWASRIRKILDYLGREWVQTVEKSGGTITYSSWENVVYKSAMDTELAKKVNVASIDITDQTTTLLELTKALGTAGTHYARWICKTGIGSANIPDKPISANNAFVCVAYATRWNNTSDYQYELLCYVGGANRPYAAIVANSTSSISWGQEALTSDIKDATLTIQKNGTTVQTFTANSSTNKTANITVPTKVTDLTDGANYVAKDGAFYVTGEGSSFSMTGTSQNVYADLKMKGDTQQIVTTGKNLFNPTTAPKCHFYINGTSLASYEPMTVSTYMAIDSSTTYTVTKPILSNNRFAIGTTPNVPAAGGTLTVATQDNNVDHITITSGASDHYLVIYYKQGNDTTSENLIFPQIQVEKSATQTSFEPYTGGVPAPSQDYPQAVEVVTGRQMISSCGKNLAKAPDGITTYASAGQTWIFTGGLIRTTRTNQDAQGGSIDITSKNTGTWAGSTGRDNHLTGNGGTYTLSFSRVGTISPKSGQTATLWTYCDIFKENGTYRNVAAVNLASDTSGTHTITIANDEHIGSIVLYSQYCSYNNLELKIQLEKGSTATSFESYLGKEIELNLGKNLFDKNNPNILQAYIDATTSVITSSNLNRIVWIPCEPNTTYTVQRVATPSWNRGVAWTETTPANGVQTYGYVQGNAGTLTITTGATAKYLVYRFYQSNSDSSTTLDNVLASVQIEKSTYATSYAPYFTPVELCKIGTYQDYIYPSGGKWYVHKEIGKMATTGSETISLSDVRIIDIGNTEAVQGQGSIVYCTHAVYKWQSVVGACYVSGAAPNICIGVSGLSSSADAQNWVATNRPVFYYRLKTPTDTEITNPLLVAQLDDLWRNLQSGTNTTNVNVEGDLPAILGVTAFTNTLASAMAGINERMNRLPAIPQITMTSTDPGEGQPLADNHFIAVYNN